VVCVSLCVWCGQKGFFEVMTNDGKSTLRLTKEVSCDAVWVWVCVLVWCGVVWGVCVLGCGWGQFPFVIMRNFRRPLSCWLWLQRDEIFLLKTCNKGLLYCRFDWFWVSIWLILSVDLTDFECHPVLIRITFSVPNLIRSIRHYIATLAPFLLPTLWRGVNLKYLFEKSSEQKSKLLSEKCSKMFQKSFRKFSIHFRNVLLTF